MMWKFLGDVLKKLLVNLLTFFIVAFLVYWFILRNFIPTF